MARVAFLGLGRMGLGMAGRLLDHGHELTVYNRTASRAATLVARGARACTSPRDAATGAEVIFAMVADDAASRAVWLGESGALSAQAAPGALAIECSTLSADWVEALASACQARALRYIDAPVTGLPEAAAAGGLTLLLGGAVTDLDAAQPLFDAVATRSFRFGPVGAGTAYKLIVNLLGAIQIASAAEGLAAAERAGLDLAVVADAVCAGQAASPQVVRHVRRIAAGTADDSEVTFTAALRLKDVEYALALYRGLGLPAAFGAAAAGHYAQLCAGGLAEASESRIIEVFRAAAPLPSPPLPAQPRP